MLVDPGVLCPRRFGHGHGDSSVGAREGFYAYNNSEKKVNRRR